VFVGVLWWGLCCDETAIRARLSRLLHMKCRGVQEISNKLRFVCPAHKDGSELSFSELIYLYRSYQCSPSLVNGERVISEMLSHPSMALSHLSRSVNPYSSFGETRDKNKKHVSGNCVILGSKINGQMTEMTNENHSFLQSNIDLHHCKIKCKSGKRRSKKYIHLCLLVSHD